MKIGYAKESTHFPLNIATDRKGVDFEFYISFSGREASINQCDGYEKGDMVQIYPPSVKNFECADVISIYMTSPKQVKVAVSHFYSSSRCSPQKGSETAKTPRISTMTCSGRSPEPFSKKCTNNIKRTSGVVLS